MRFPLQGAVLLETSHISLDDRFAAQIVYATGRCPPMYRLVTDCCSFHFQFHGLRLQSMPRVAAYKDRPVTRGFR